MTKQMRLDIAQVLGWGAGVARVDWCRAQRRSLRTPGRFVVWVRRETLPPRVPPR